MYVLVDYGLIHKYAILRKDIKTIEDTTFYAVKILKDLSGYKIKKYSNKIIFNNESENLIFKRNQSSSPLIWMLDEF